MDAGLVVRCPLRLPAQPPARGGMREGWCSRASPPIFSTRLPLHSLVSLAGLPKYDLSSGLAREADKSPLRTKFGRANSTALATHTPRLASPNMSPPQDQARSSVCEQRRNEMENSPIRGATRQRPARRRRRTLAYVNELAYFGAPSLRSSGRRESFR